MSTQRNNLISSYKRRFVNNLYSLTLLLARCSISYLITVTLTQSLDNIYQPECEHLIMVSLRPLHFLGSKIKRSINLGNYWKKLQLTLILENLLKKNKKA